MTTVTNLTEMQSSGHSRIPRPQEKNAGQNEWNVEQLEDVRIINIRKDSVTEAKKGAFLVESSLEQVPIRKPPNFMHEKWQKNCCFCSFCSIFAVFISMRYPGCLCGAHTAPWIDAEWTSDAATAFTFILEKLRLPTGFTATRMA